MANGLEWDSAADRELHILEQNKFDELGTHRVKMVDSAGVDIDANNPIPTNIDRITPGDVDTDNSDNGGFSGVVTDHFDNLFSVNSDTTATNPKIIKIWFKHSIQLYNIGFGCNESGKSFSNIKIILFGSDEAVRETIDDTGNDTKYTSKTYDFGPSKANGVIIEFHTADEVCLSNLIIWKATNVNAHILALDQFTGFVGPVTSFKGHMNVHQGDLHNFIVNTNFHQHDSATTTISTASLAGDTSVSVVDNSGFSLGDNVELRDGATREINGAIVTIDPTLTPGALTLDRPLDSPYSIGSTVERLVHNVAAGVLGSLVAPISFQVAPPPGEKWHIQRVMMSGVFGSAADDGLFGNQPALLNGIVLRQNLSIGLFTTSVWKTNGDMKLDQFDLPYTSRAPGGQFGMNGRFTNKKVDVSYALDGDNGDFLEILRQDNITISELYFKAQGHKANV